MCLRFKQFPGSVLQGLTTGVSLAALHSAAVQSSTAGLGYSHGLLAQGSGLRCGLLLLSGGSLPSRRRAEHGYITDPRMEMLQCMSQCEPTGKSGISYSKPGRSGDG